VFGIKIDFEIICVDDASQDYQSNNGEIQFYQIASIMNCLKTSGEVQFEIYPLNLERIGYFFWTVTPFLKALILFQIISAKLN
jgi:hypothetical protein